MRDDLAIAKEVACNMLNVDYKVEDKFGGLFIYHPFFNAMCLMDRDGLFFINEEPQRFEKLKKDMARQIMRADSIFGIMAFMMKPYYINYLVLINQYGISDKVCGDILGDVWCSLENNDLQDKSTKRLMRRWFRASDRSKYLSESDLEVYNNLPNEIEIYRGSQLNEPVDGFCWSLSRDVADWFAHRYDNSNPVVHKANIKKSDVFAYTNAVDEQEVIVDYKKLYNIEEI